MGQTQKKGLIWFSQLSTSIVRSKWFSLKTFFPWLLMGLRISYFALQFLSSVCELDSPLKIPWKPTPDLIEGDLWWLRILSKILVPSWNHKSLSFSSNLPFTIIPQLDMSLSFPDTTSSWFLQLFLFYNKYIHTQ